jgi:hypothetical protein
MDDFRGVTRAKGRSEQDSFYWHKSSRSNSDGTCVEVAVVDAHVLVRDSKEPAGPRLRFSRDVWAAFINDVRNGNI